MKTLMNRPGLHGKCVPATQSCGTDPFLVVLRLINEHMGERGGKSGMQGNTGAKSNEKQEIMRNTKQHQTRTQGYDGEVKG
jgi:hypothetical protein